MMNYTWNSGVSGLCPRPGVPNGTLRLETDLPPSSGGKVERKQVFAGQRNLIIRGGFQFAKKTDSL